MNITLNGQKELTEHTDLLQLIAASGFSPDALIAEVNGVIIKQHNWQQTPVADGDTIELLHFVGGG